jgi:signal transduction histidine kinase
MKFPFQSFRKKHPLNLVWLSVAFGAAYWLLESLRDVFLFQKGDLLKRIFYPDLMSVWMRLLVVCILVLFGVYAQTLRSKMRLRGKLSLERVRSVSILLAGTGFGLGYWLLEAFRDVFIYEKGNLLHQIVHPDSLDFWMRFLPVCILFLFSAYTQNLFNAHIRIQESLKETNKRLEELGQMKNDFLSTVSHELRTPIAIMKEGVSLCMDERVGALNPVQNKLLADVVQNIDRLNRLVTDLLDLSKIEAGKLKLRRSAFDFNQTADKIGQLYLSRAEQQKIRLEVRTPATPVSIFADEDKITQIFDNLLSNAMRFTPPGGHIRITVDDRPDCVECHVSDTGVGISEENQKKLFSKFEQFGRVNGPGYKGTGLGLSICKGLVEKHQGKIWLESQSGKGSTFFFTLKKAPFPKILIVDDEREIVDLVKSLLSVDRYEFIEAYDGETAFQKAVEEIPSLVVLDMHLGRMSGYEVIGRLKQDRRTAKIPVLIMSGYSVDEKMLENQGPHAQIPILRKPLRVEQLRHSVREAFFN